MPLGANELILLIGAGCSFRAGIPTSEQMLRELHKLLDTDDNWKPYHALYSCVRGLILHADALRGQFDESLNIERIVAALGEIEQREENALFPFVQSLDSRFTGLAGEGFSGVRKFRRIIVDRLIEWICPKSYDASTYYRHIYELASDYNYALRVFTLNYDLCLEYNAPDGQAPERGFDDVTREWDYRRFEADNEGTGAIFYYKMHGSIDWERDPQKGNVVKQVAHPSLHPDLIFGTVNKLQSFDPYLFYAYHFRQYSLTARVILVIGYSFSDLYINDILKQAILSNKERKMVVVSPSAKEEDVYRRLQVDNAGQVVVSVKKAEDFLPGLTLAALCQQAGIDLTEPGDPMKDI